MHFSCMLSTLYINLVYFQIKKVKEENKPTCRKKEKNEIKRMKGEKALGENCMAKNALWKL